jgi:phosphoglycolate phosphatase
MPPASTRPVVLLFDLDGTLTDPREGMVRSIRYALDRLATPCPSDEVLASFIGPPLRGTFGTLLNTLDRGVIEEGIALYRQRYAETGLYENAVYDGVPEMLEEARRAASALYIATSKPAVYAERILRHFGLDRYFAGVYGAELGGRFDHKVELLPHLLTAEKVAPETAIMVGDRATDIAAARTSGLRSIGVLWGYGSEEELAGAGPEALCPAPRDFAHSMSLVRPRVGRRGRARP